MGFHGRTQPKITMRNAKLCLEWCTARRHWPLEQWKHFTIWQSNGVLRSPVSVLWVCMRVYFRMASWIPSSRLVGPIADWRSDPALSSGETAGSSITDSFCSLKSQCSFVRRELLCACCVGGWSGKFVKYFVTGPAGMLKGLFLIIEMVHFT